MTPSFCPNCGYDLVAEETINIGAATFARHRQFSYAGKPVHLSPCERIVVEALMRAKGGLVSIPVLIERMGLEAADPANIVRVYVTRLRNILRGLGAPEGLIQNDHSCGYRWAVELENQAEAA